MGPITRATTGRRATALAIAAGTALAGALVVSGGAAGPPDELADGSLAQLAGAPDGSVLAAGLVTATSCEELVTSLSQLAVRSAPTGPRMAVDDEMADDSAAGAPAAVGDEAAAMDVAVESAAPVGEGGTNVQVAGVDEPDLVERMGDLLVTGVGGVVRVLEVVDGQPVERGALDLLPSGDLGLMAVGPDRVVALGQGQGDDGAGRSAPEGDVMIMPAYAPTTVVALVDLSDPAAPVELSRLEMDGWNVAARAVDGVLRLAVREDAPWVDPWAGGPVDDEATMQQRLADGYAATTVQDWVPQVTTTTGDTSTTEQLVACDRVGVPTSFAGMGTLTIASVDATGSTLAVDDAEAVVASGEALYASADRLVVATTAWGGGGPGMPMPMVEPGMEVDPLPAQPVAPPVQEGPSSDLHVFDVDGTLVTHVASGRVEGRLVNQFAMSIHDGVLRTAVTTGGWGDQLQSSVVTHRVEGDQLVEVGRVDGLGPTEEIRSVRFMGDTAYVVTFMRTDPLYVVDLSDPAAPRTRGELKIEGYSSYLHPLTDDLLLGVGQDADPATGMERGLQVSTFDVADPTAPTRVDVDVIPQSYSEAQWDHHAVMITRDAAAPAWLVGMPIEVWSDTGGARLGAQLHRVADSGQVDALGMLEVGDRWELQPRRVLQVGDVVVTVAAGGVTTWDPATLQAVGQVTYVAR